MTEIAKQVTIAEFIADQLAVTDKTQRQVAEECGFDMPNIITMFKQGRTKVPLDRVGALAKALGVDPVHLLRLAMQEYMPETWKHIEKILQSTMLTANELELVQSFRRITGDSDAKAVVVNRDAILAVVLS